MSRERPRCSCQHTQVASTRYPESGDCVPRRGCRRIAGRAHRVHAHHRDVALHSVEGGGQKGPQRKILREGTYAINLAQFVVLTQQGTLALNLDKSETSLFAKMSEVIRARNGFIPVVIKDDLDRLGVVTTHDGPALPPGEIIAPPVGDDPTDAVRFHNNFQDCEAKSRTPARWT
jgi:hypothetical protein